MDRAIASIRGIVEIEQARIDGQRQNDQKAKQNAREQAQENLQNSITAIGTDIGAGSFFASSSGLMTQPWRSPWDKDHSAYPHPFLLSLLLSILIALEPGGV